MTYSYPKVTYSDPKVTYSDPKVTHSDPTHFPLPPHASPDLHLAISWVKLNLRVVVVGGGWQPTLMEALGKGLSFKAFQGPLGAF